MTTQKNKQSPIYKTTIKPTHRRRIFFGIGLTTLVFSTLACQAGLRIRPPQPRLEANLTAGYSASPSPNSGPPPNYVETTPNHTAQYQEAPPPSPVALDYTQSGGLTEATAEVIATTAQLKGRLGEDQTRNYAVHLNAGDSLNFLVYQRSLDDYAGLNIKIMEPDNVRLTSKTEYSSKPSSELNRFSFRTTAKHKGTHMLKVTSTSGPSEYDIRINGEIQAP